MWEQHLIIWFDSLPKLSSEVAQSAALSDIQKSKDLLMSSTDELGNIAKHRSVIS